MVAKNQKSDYEEARLAKIEENNKRMAELGIQELVQTLLICTGIISFLPKRKMVQKKLDLVQRKKSSRNEGKPKTDYRDMSLSVILIRSPLDIFFVQALKKDKLRSKRLMHLNHLLERSFQVLETSSNELYCTETGLSGGWVGFSQYHKIIDGDACVFQRTKSTEFKVNIPSLSSTHACNTLLSSL
ncbi:hypothetical protein MKX03_026891 [Papaver bracteatum]|nr:hypothetical protein MKX03_026891 [Papaver bracteatum]